MNIGFIRNNIKTLTLPNRDGSFKNLEYPKDWETYYSLGWRILVLADPIPEGYELLSSSISYDSVNDRYVEENTLILTEDAELIRQTEETNRQISKSMDLKNAENRLLHFYRKYIAGLETIVKLPTNYDYIGAIFLQSVYDNGQLNDYIALKSILEGCERNVVILGGDVSDSFWHEDAEWIPVEG